jgi:chemotaxis protein MotA
MDKATILGLVIGIGAIFGVIAMEGDVTAFVDIPGIAIIIAGSVGSTMIAFPMHSCMSVPGTLMHVFKVKVPEARDEIRRLVDYATLSRREGVLALEPAAAEIRDPFLKRGLEMIIDKAPREKLEETLSIEITSLHERHTTGKKIFENLGAMAPAFGMVGTLIGLILMLGSLDDPSKIGSGMAVAMVTTFYGAFVSNLIFLPIATKLETRSKEEMQVRELTLQGLIGIIEGENPRALEARLKSYLAPKQRRETAGTPASTAA